jgi:hypothetical protein
LLLLPLPLSQVLVAIANGALFVTPRWVADSLAAGRWLPEEGPEYRVANRRVTGNRGVMFYALFASRQRERGREKGVWWM